MLRVKIIRELIASEYPGLCYVVFQDTTSTLVEIELLISVFNFEVSKIFHTRRPSQVIIVKEHNEIVFACDFSDIPFAIIYSDLQKLVPGLRCPVGDPESGMYLLPVCYQLGPYMLETTICLCLN